MMNTWAQSWEVERDRCRIVAKEVHQLAGYHADDIKACLAAKTLEAELAEEGPSGLRI
jgi:hypothetical protein